MGTGQTSPNPALPTKPMLISWRAVKGYPTSGSLGTLPDTPEWVKPAVGATQSLHEPLEWKLYDKDVPFTGVMPFNGPTEVWVVFAGPNATKATIPEPPSTFDAAELGSGLDAQIFEAWPLDPTAPGRGFLWELEATSWSRPFQLGLPCRVPIKP